MGEEIVSFLFAKYLKRKGFLCVDTFSFKKFTMFLSGPFVQWVPVWPEVLETISAFFALIKKKKRKQVRKLQETSSFLSYL
jgi:hypothetical protein